MIIKNIDVSAEKNTRLLTIGRQYENNYREFIFDCSGFGEVEEITLVHQRSEDAAPYVVATSTESSLTWIVSNTDTLSAGWGKAELRFTLASGLAKSMVYETYVAKSITAETTVPSVLQSWYDAMLEYIDERKISVEELDDAIAHYMAEHPVQSEPEIYWINTSSTNSTAIQTIDRTYAEVKEAAEAGKLIILRHSIIMSSQTIIYYYIPAQVANTGITFTELFLTYNGSNMQSKPQIVILHVNGDITYNIQKSLYNSVKNPLITAGNQITSSSTTSQIPSAKAVYDFVMSVVNNS